MLVLLNEEKKIIGLNLFPQYKKNLKNLEEFFKIIKKLNDYIVKNNIELKEIYKIDNDKFDETKKIFIVDIDKDILKLFFEKNNNDHILEKENKNEIDEIDFEINDYEYKENINKEELKDLEINFINENFEENFWK